MTDYSERTAKVIGKDALEILKGSSVIVFGVGGVGGYVVESLARCGIGRIGIVDFDDISLTNINRQIIATNSSVGMKKVDAFEKRILDINTDAIVEKYPIKYSEETAGEIDLKSYDYVVDAIDDVAAKLLLIKNSHALGIKIISSMGMGNKLDPSKIEITKISKTSMDPLARKMRRLLKEEKIDIDVCYSKEEPKNLCEDKRTPGSTPFVPPAAGLFIGSKIVRELI